MNALERIKTLDIDYIPKEYHEAFIKEVIQLGCRFPDNHIIPSLENDIMGELSGVYALASILALIQKSSSYLEDFLMAEGVTETERQTDRFEYWVRENLSKYRQADGQLYNGLLDDLTRNVMKVLEHYNIFYRIRSHTFLPVGSLSHLDKEVTIHEMINLPIVTVW